MKLVDSCGTQLSYFIPGFCIEKSFSSIDLPFFIAQILVQIFCSSTYCAQAPIRILRAEEVDRKKGLVKAEGGKGSSLTKGVADEEELEEIEDDEEDVFGASGGVESKSYGKKKRSKSKRAGVDPENMMDEEGGEDADVGAGGEGKGDVFSLMGMPGSGGQRPKSSRLPGMRVREGR